MKIRLVEREGKATHLAVARAVPLVRCHPLCSNRWRVAADAPRISGGMPPAVVGLCQDLLAPGLHQVLKQG
jgi:hypothetical protein